MLDLYLGLRQSGPDCAVYLLQHRVRGWNAELAEPSPVADARWALSQIRAAHEGVPIALLGHSMGGRTAMAVASTPGVVGVCALAPWLPTDEPLPPENGSRRVVIAHGSADRTTSSTESEAFARRLRDRGDDVAFVVQRGGRHALLDGFWDWHRFAVRSTLAMVDAAPWPIALRAALDDGSHPLDLREIARDSRN
jgi:dienelactone hydrolase